MLLLLFVLEYLFMCRSNALILIIALPDFLTSSQVVNQLFSMLAKGSGIKVTEYIHENTKLLVFKETSMMIY